MHIHWDNTEITDISGIKIDMSTEAKVSIFTDNDLTHINNDHFEINIVARLLNQIYIVPVPPPRYDYYCHDLEKFQGTNYFYFTLTKYINYF